MHPRMELETESATYRAMLQLERYVRGSSINPTLLELIKGQTSVKESLTMITAKFLETMALYNKWQNESLFKICDALNDEQLCLNRGMFFDSIFKTLNHIIHVDETIYALIQTKTLSKFDPGFVPFPKYSELRVARSKFDEKLIQDSQSCSQEWLDEILESWSERLQRNRSVPRSFYYIQLFNHQTHHRSQITSELHKIGVDYGNTDLPYNPYYEF